MLNNLNFNEKLKWWVRGLGYLCPPPLRKAFNASADLITIRLEDQQAVFSYFNDESNEADEIKRFNLDDDIEKAATLNWLNEQIQKNTQVVLTIPDNFFLKKKMALPKATSSNLRQVLSFEISRKTPFTAEQTYFDYILLEQDKASDKISLELSLVPRDKINPQLNMLKTWHVNLNAIRPENQYNNEGINLIPPEQQQSGSESDKVMLTMVTITFLLFITVLYLPIFNQEKKLDLLNASVAKSRKAAIQLQTLKKNKEKLLEQSHFLENKRINEISSIELINEVTQIIPDDTWLTRFVMKSGELQLQGESSNASSLIQIVESSDYFLDAQFRSPVTQNKISNKDKFHLSAKFGAGKTPS